MDRIEEEDYYGDKEEEEEEEEEEGEVSEISYRVNDEVTLHQPELCAIYTAIHWAWKPDGAPWNDIEIKQIIGHAILRLDEYKYHRLNLGDVIGFLHREDGSLTKAVKPVAEKLKSNLVSWVPQQYEKYLYMCRKDEKLAQQQQQEENLARRASSQTQPDKKRRLEETGLYDSITAGPSGSFISGSQSVQAAPSATRPLMSYPSIAEVLAGSSEASQDIKD